MKKREKQEKHAPAPIAEALANYLAQSGLAKRVDQAGVIPDWEALVGPQISAVTRPLSVTQGGLLFVAVTTHGWMTELSLLEPELLKKLNAKAGRQPVERIRWLLRRE